MTSQERKAADIVRAIWEKHDNADQNKALRMTAFLAAREAMVKLFEATHDPHASHPFDAQLFRALCTPDPSDGAIDV